MQPHFETPLHLVTEQGGHRRARRSLRQRHVGFREKGWQGPSFLLAALSGTYLAIAGISMRSPY